MLRDSHAFSGFSVNDINAAKEFYGGVLGLDVEVDAMGMQIKLADGSHVFVYTKEDHQPASFTILNFPVADIDKAVDELIAAGVVFEHYDVGEMKLDERGVFHSDNPEWGPSIAWFKDPAGNVLSVLSD